MNIKIISLLWCMANLQTIVAQKIGEQVPEILLTNTKDSAISLQSLKGKVVILDFWATWCGPCLQANKTLSKIYKKYQPQGLEIYAVSLDADKIKWSKFVKSQNWNWMQVIDAGVWNAPTAVNWGIDRLPTTFLIDKKGVLRYYNLHGTTFTNVIEMLLKE